MKRKQMIRITVDLFMTISLIFLMAYIFTGDLPHEIVGTVMIVLWVVHHILNYKWFPSLIKGKYTIKRVFNTLLNIFLLISAAGLIFSGIILSSYVFGFAGIEWGIGLARKVHLVSSYWFYILSSLHLGLQWNKIAGVISRSLKDRFTGTGRGIRIVLARILVIILSGWGVSAFIKHRIFDNLFLRTPFPYFDFEEPVVLFFAEYLGIMVLFASFSYYLSRLYLKISRSRSEITGTEKNKIMDKKLLGDSDE